MLSPLALTCKMFDAAAAIHGPDALTGAGRTAEPPIVRIEMLRSATGLKLNETSKMITDHRWLRAAVTPSRTRENMTHAVRFYNTVQIICFQSEVPDTNMSELWTALAGLGHVTLHVATFRAHEHLQSC